MPKPKMREEASPEFIRQLKRFRKSDLIRTPLSKEDEEVDRRYWLSRTPAERLMALERLRQLVWGYDEKNRIRLSKCPELLKLQTAKPSRDKFRNYRLPRPV